ncbi:MAG: UDP-glucose 4-epimerase GalE [Candidatus Omnitrophica bacterium]|nr:UDP-glucose 4-epimerase GalE [Candidatus Omnitrophota bacterium]
MSTILVVGGAGYIGSATSRFLKKKGYEVVVLDNLSKGHREAVPEETVLIEGDLGDRARIVEICGEYSIKTALHFAAFTQVGESVEQPSMYFDNNSFRTKNLLDGLVEAGVDQFIFSSTAAVYGEPHEIPISEDHPKSPTNPYGWSKLFVEEMLESYRVAYGLRSVRLRYFNAAGALDGHGEDHTPEAHLIPLVLQVALGQRDSISIFGTDWETPDGTCIRDYIHIADLAKAHFQAMEWLDSGSQGGFFNLGNGEGHSVKEVIETSREVTGHSIPVVETDRRPGDPARLVASNQKAKEALGWEPDHPTLKEIVGTAWEWHRTHPNGYRSP